MPQNTNELNWDISKKAKILCMCQKETQRDLRSAQQLLSLHHKHHNLVMVFLCGCVFILLRLSLPMIASHTHSFLYSFLGWTSVNMIFKAPFRNDAMNAMNT